MQNKERAARAATALAAYVAQKDVDQDAALQDLITDLLHLADTVARDGENVSDGIIRRAVMNYEAERDELAEWSGSLCHDDPDNYWINDATGERIKAS